MTVKKARFPGFCMGVRRAVELAYKEAENAKADGSAVFTFGALIHNPNVLKDLESRGVRSIGALPQTPDCTVIIRAHGITPAAEEKLRGAGCRVVDATCPKVKASQLKTQELVRAGYFLFLAGEAEHAEIEGIMGYFRQAQQSKASLNEGDTCSESDNSCVIVSCEQEAKEASAALFKNNKNAKTALLGQTTVCENEYKKIADKIKEYFPALEVVDTICTATKDRQSALRELLPETDAVIIAGGENSANTRRLLSIAQESGKPCVLAETADDIPLEYFSFNIVGLCAGASTPDSVINEIEAKLNKASR